MGKPKVFILTGPTAVGKSEAAVRIAEAFNAEVISADSMQIYRGFDIGTGKITKSEMRGIMHHMIDIAEPDEVYSVGKYVQAARKIIHMLHEKNKPIVVSGGTGLYLNALTNGYNFADIDANNSLRSHYQSIAETKGSDALYQMLCNCDTESAKKISPNDTKRIIRALEIYELTGQAKSARITQTDPELDIHVMILNCEREQLYARINRRVEKMIANGLENEVRSLMSYRECPSMQAIGYKEFIKYFDGEATHQQTIELIQKRSRNYAKRQMTYFRGFQANKEWVDATDLDAAYYVIHEGLSRFLN